VTETKNSDLLSEGTAAATSALMVVAILTYLFIVGDQPIWGTNDDVGMSLLAGGALLSSEPTSNLLFINPYYGVVLKNLYSTWPDVPWYALLFLAILTLSLSVAGFSVLRNFRKPGRLWVLVIFYALYATCYVGFTHFQFTIISAISGLASLLLATSLYFRVPESKGLSTALICLSALLQLLSYLIRVSACQMMLALIGPCVLALVTLSWIARECTKRRNFHLITPLFITLVIGGLTQVLPLQEDAEDWARWSRMNLARGNITDYRRDLNKERAIQAFRDVGWSENDYRMVTSWQYIDGERYTLEKFEKVSNILWSELPISEVTRDSLLTRLQGSALEVFWSCPSVIAFCVLAIFCVEDRRVWIPFGCLLATYGILTFYVQFVLERAPLRVVYPLWFGVGWFALFSAIRYRNDSIRFQWGHIPRLVVLLLAFGLIRFEYTNLRVQSLNMAAAQTDLTNLMQEWKLKLPEDALVYDFGGMFPLLAHRPLTSFSYFRDFGQFLANGTRNQSPVQNKMLQKYGLGSQFYPRLAEKELYLVLPYDVEHPMYKLALDAFRTHYKEVYQIDVSLEESESIRRLLKLEFN